MRKGFAARDLLPFVGEFLAAIPIVLWSLFAELWELLCFFCGVES